ncbi:DNA recombination protein RmuC (plasmid) [Pedobacter sp. BS3]|uniref:DNA recombination protein RmuC n=1 Tax=Pedobacter sp. BS3 TaxID=2567937 RepID=UPI0011ED501A|nr:DNA recombination protein RmuC [Pedobacter sp. BS3]TZF85903.1 DNA recombination protein RmuC [Pedobacter sp. BS3]
MEFVLIGISVVILIVVILLFIKKPQHASGISTDEFNQLKAENEQLKIRLAAAEQQIKSGEAEKLSVTQLLKEEKLESEGKLTERINRLEDEKNSLIEQLTNEKKRMSQAEEAFKAQREKLAEQKQYIDELQLRFKTEFENIANKILDEKSQKFTEVNRSNLDILLNPLKENIKAFEEKVEKVYKAESDERNVLKGEISKLMELNKQISEEANNLTKALKADSKKQGNWGEIVLDKILEASGLIEGESYTKQSSYTDELGNRLQPDVVITLPDNKHVIIDSKVSLLAYERMVNCETEEERSGHLKNHLSSIRNHIGGLSAKNYQDLYQINSPDFVLLFIPIESSFAIAIQNDIELFDYAWNRRIVIVTPSTLLATLRTIASIWKQEQQTRNAIEIATKAGALYDKFVLFTEDLKKIGDSIERSQKSYSEAMNKLNTGSGNIIGRVETLRRLGAKASKQLDQKLISEEE